MSSSGETAHALVFRMAFGSEDGEHSFAYNNFTFDALLYDELTFFLFKSLHLPSAFKNLQHFEYHCHGGLFWVEKPLRPKSNKVGFDYVDVLQLDF